MIPMANVQVQPIVAQRLGMFVRGIGGWRSIERRLRLHSVRALEELPIGATSEDYEKHVELALTADLDMTARVVLDDDADEWTPRAKHGASTWQALGSEKPLWASVIAEAAVEAEQRQEAR